MFEIIPEVSVLWNVFCCLLFSQPEVPAGSNASLSNSLGEEAPREKVMRCPGVSVTRMFKLDLVLHKTLQSFIFAPISSICFLLSFFYRFVSKKVCGPFSGQSPQLSSLPCISCLELRLFMWYRQLSTGNKAESNAWFHAGHLASDSHPSFCSPIVWAYGYS